MSEMEGPGPASTKWGAGDFRDIHCRDCGKKTEHVYFVMIPVGSFSGRQVTIGNAQSAG